MERRQKEMEKLGENRVKLWRNVGKVRRMKMVISSGNSRKSIRWSAVPVAPRLVYVWLRYLEEQWP